jgi:hypothetical protein
MPEQVKELGPRWTRELLIRCTPREILALVAVYGPIAVAARLGYRDIAEFAKERFNVS